MSSESATRKDSNRFIQLQRLAQCLGILDLTSIGIILSKQHTSKALIRLRWCAGWSAPLLFAYGIKQVFSWHGSNNSLVQYRILLDHMNAFEFLNLLKELVKMIRCEAMLSIFSIFPNKFNKFSKTGAHLSYDTKITFFSTRCSRFCSW